MMKTHFFSANLFRHFKTFFVLCLTVLCLFSCSKDDKLPKEKSPAEKLTFQKVSKAFTSGGKFSTTDILAGVRGNKTGYTVKNITSLSPSNLATVTASKELNFSGGAGSFTATLVLEHPTKADVTLTNCAFEIYAENLTFRIDKYGVVSLRNGVVKSRVTTLTIPRTIEGITVTGIGSRAFYSCYKLTTITIPNSVTTIGDSTFYNCSALTAITIPNSVTTGDRAFWNCSALTAITIPNSVTTIGDSTFWDCSALTAITIPNSVTTIGDNVFQYCRSLTSIRVPSAKRSGWLAKLKQGNGLSDSDIIGY